MHVQNYKCTCTLIVIWDILIALNEWRSSESGWNKYWLILASCEMLMYMYTCMTIDIDDYMFYHMQNTCTSICTCTCTCICTCISNDLISYRERVRHCMSYYTLRSLNIIMNTFKIQIFKYRDNYIHTTLCWIPSGSGPAL